MGYRNYSTATPYIVDQDGHGDFLTITSAMAAAAVTGGSVFVKSGTYAESFTLPPSVSLSAYPSIPTLFGASVGAIVQGTVTFTGNGESTISGISLTTSAAASALVISGADAGALFVYDCIIEGGASDAISISNGSVQSIFNTCFIINPVSDALNLTDGSVVFNSCNFFNIGGTGALTVDGGPTRLEMRSCDVEGAITGSNGCGIFIKTSKIHSFTLTDASQGSLISCNLAATGTAITTSGTSSFDLLQSSLTASSLPAISIGAGTIGRIDQSSVDVSGVGYAIDGLGSFSYGLIEFTGNSDIDPGLTILLNPVRPYSTAGASSSFAERGLCSFDSSDFAVDTDGFVSLVISGLAWVDVTAATQTISAATGYLANHATSVTFTLPASATLGDIFRIVGIRGSWTIAQNANQQIKIGSNATTVGVGGSLSSTNAGDCVECVATNTSASTVWRVMSSVGNLTVV